MSLPVSHFRVDGIDTDPIRVTFDKTPRQHFRLARLRLPRLLAGDILIINAEAQVESRNLYAVGIGDGVFAGMFDAEPGKELVTLIDPDPCPGLGDNVRDKIDHYARLTRGASWTVTPEAAGLDAIHWLAWSHTDDPRAKVGKPFVTPKPKGQLSVVIYRGA